MLKLMALKMSSNILASKLHGKITTAKYEWQKNALKGKSQQDKLVQKTVDGVWGGCCCGVLQLKVSGVFGVGRGCVELP